MSEKEELLYYLLKRVQSLPHNSQNYNATTPMANKQGKTNDTLTSFPVYFSLSSCCVAINKFFVSVDENDPPVLGFT